MRKWLYLALTLMLAMSASALFVHQRNHLEPSLENASLISNAEYGITKIDIDGQYKIVLSVGVSGELGGSVKNFTPSLSKVESIVNVQSEKNIIKFVLVSSDDNQNEALKNPFHIEISNNNSFDKLFLSKNENNQSAEIKRIIASSFQLSTEINSKTIRETSDLGVANATYQFDKNSLTKRIDSILEPPQNSLHKENINVFSTSEFTRAITSGSNINKIERDASQAYITNSTGEKIVKKINLIALKIGAAAGNIDISESEKVGLPLNFIRSFREEAISDSIASDDIDVRELEQIFSDIELLNEDDMFWKNRDKLIFLIDNNDKLSGKIIDALKNTNSDLLTAHIIGMLGQTNSPAGQKLLINILDSEDFGDEAKYQAIINLGLVSTPTTDTIKYATDLIVDTNKISPKYIFAVGSIIGSGRRNLPDQYNSESLTYANNVIKDIYYSSDDLTTKLNALTALGNAGIPENRSLLIEALSNENPSIRARAIDSMRLDPDPEIMGYIFSTADSDPSPEVREKSLNTLMFRNIGESDYHRLSSYALSDPNDSVRSTALKVMYQNPVDKNTLEETALIISNNESDSRVADLAQAILKKSLKM